VPTFHLEIHTPYRLFFSGEVEALVADLRDGQIGVRAGRAPFVSPLETCAISLLMGDGTWKKAAVDSGIIETTREKTVILSGSAEWPEEIDSHRAEDAAARAGETLTGDLAKYEADQTRAALHRAQIRMRVARETAKPNLEG